MNCKQCESQKGYQFKDTDEILCVGCVAKRLPDVKMPKLEKITKKQWGSGHLRKIENIRYKTDYHFRQ